MDAVLNSFQPFVVFFSLSDDLGCNPLKFSIETENEDLNFSIFQILVKYFPRLQPFIEKCGLYLSGDDTYATVRQRSLLNIIQNFPNSGTESSPIFLTASIFIVHVLFPLTIFRFFDKGKW